MMVVYASTTDRHRPSVRLNIYIGRVGKVAAAVVVVLLGVADDVLLRCVPMVMATMSAIDGYGFSFNYVEQGEHH